MHSTPKWYSKHRNDIVEVFDKIRRLEIEFRFLTKKYAADNHLDLLHDYEFTILVEDTTKAFTVYTELQEIVTNESSLPFNKKMQRNPYNVLLKKKLSLRTKQLKSRFFQLMFVINKLNLSLLKKSVESEIYMNLSLQLTNLVNQNVGKKLMQFENDATANICSNTYPSLLLPAKRIEIGIILQLISQNRTEQCSMGIMNALFNLYPQNTERKLDASNSSSLEILNTLTNDFAIEPEIYTNNNGRNLTFKKDNFIDHMTNTNLLDTMTNIIFRAVKQDYERQQILTENFATLISEEENFFTYIIGKCYQLCPSAFGESKITIDAHTFRTWIARGIKGLWIQTGSILDHILMWWNDAPLSCYPVSHTIQLRQWLLNQNLQMVPEPISSTLIGLGDILTNYVSNILWDQQFRLALIGVPMNEDIKLISVGRTDSQQITNTTPTGNVWIEVFKNLKDLNNSCSQNGTIPNQLPIVEQIPILHRLGKYFQNHSVHTFRLWTKEKSKLLCFDWQMSMFFKVLEGDLKISLNELNNLKLPKLAEDDTIDILILVCVSLRSKLISEINSNVDKLKKTTAECIEIMSSVCRTYSLATFSLCFPLTSYWQSKEYHETSGEYVTYFLQEIFYPILQATLDIDIMGLVLKIICESWLDYIYMKRIKFSIAGAMNLLKDFDGVQEWLSNCSLLSVEHSEYLGNHEFLRMCKGVGRILLRKPEDVVSILNTPKYSKGDSDNDDDRTKLPFEMFVPNQKHWLELRARNDGHFSWLCVCNTDVH